MNSSKQKRDVVCCKRGACQAPGAVCVHTQTGDVYCRDCAFLINRENPEVPNLVRVPMTRHQIEEKVREIDWNKYMHLTACSASTTFGHALNQGWITRQEYDLIEKSYGRLWNYCGD